MKTYRHLLGLLIFVPIFFLNSCDLQDVTTTEGSLELGVLIDQQLKSTPEDSIASVAHFLVITVVNEDGEIVLDNEKIELLNFGGHWTTREIRLKTGHYKLTKFLVVNGTGNVRFACPIKDSPKAYLVLHPLPLKFEINKDEVTRVEPEVLTIIEDPPEDFGYVAFGYEVVNPLPFFVGVFIDNNQLMASAAVSPARFTEAKLTVIAISEEWKYSFKLEPRINKVIIRDGYLSYLLVVQKEGFESVRKKVTHEELLKTGPDNPLLIGLHSGNLVTLLLKPNADEGKDATVFMSKPDENFGKYPYFEAACAPPHIWYCCNKELSRSLIDFDIPPLPKSATIRHIYLRLFHEYNLYFWEDKPIYKDSISPDYYSKYIGVFQRILEPWKEEGVTWNEQPGVTAENQVFVEPMNISPNIFRMNVTKLVKDMIHMPDSSYGMLFKLVHENHKIPGFSFCSSDHENKEWHPELVIQYTLPE